MRSRALKGCAIAVLLAAGSACHSQSRHEVLTLFFDGVPPPEPTVEQKAAALAQAPPARHFSEHGPYGAKLCDSCHQSAASNTFVAPPDKLCVQCHEPGPQKKLQHDPFASGDCLSCHDPHSSPWRSLLVARPNDVCAECHETEMLPEDASHRDAAKVCIDCHDAHQSDKEALLR